MTHSSSLVGPDPSWSPDGSKVAFWRDGDLWIVKADGTGATDLTNGSNTGVSPDWAPDGLHLVYVGADGQIWTIGTDGTGAGQLVTHANHDDRGPSWSPDGTSIAFSSDRSGQLDAYVMHADGAKQHRITTSGTLGAAWQPCPTTCAPSPNMPPVRRREPHRARTEPRRVASPRCGRPLAARSPR